MATLRDRHQQLTRELLVSSALDAFAEKGYAATTIDDITSRAGTSRTTFYLHFPSKADLVNDLIRALDATFTGADEPPLDVVVERGERRLIAQWIDRKFDQWVQARPYLTAAYRAAPIEDAVDQALQEWFEQTTASMVDGLDRAGRVDPEERHIRCVLAFGQFEYLARRWLHVGWTVDRAVTHRAVTDAWCHLLEAS